MVDISKVRISRHAREQFVNRGAKYKSDAHTELRLKRNLARAQEVFKHERNYTMSLLKYGIKPTHYLMRRGWVYVVVEDTLTTCYQADLRKFVRADGTSF